MTIAVVGLSADHLSHTRSLLAPCTAPRRAFSDRAVG